MDFNSKLVEADLQIKKLINYFIDEELCGCNNEVMDFTNKVLAIRKGVDLDIRSNNTAEGEIKLDLLLKMFSGDDYKDCNC